MVKSARVGDVVQVNKKWPGYSKVGAVFAVREVVQAEYRQDLGGAYVLGTKEDGGYWLDFIDLVKPAVGTRVRATDYGSGVARREAHGKAGTVTTHIVDGVENHFKVKWDGASYDLSYTADYVEVVVPEPLADWELALLEPIQEVPVHKYAIGDEVKSTGHVHPIIGEVIRQPAGPQDNFYKVVVTNELGQFGWKGETVTFKEDELVPFVAHVPNPQQVVEAYREQLKTQLLGAPVESHPIIQAKLAAVKTALQLINADKVKVVD